MFKTIGPFLLILITLINVKASYHHIVVQIFNTENNLVPPILTVKEGSNLTLICKTLHLAYRPASNYYDEDIIWSRAQNWRLQRIYHKSLSNLQKNAMLTFDSITLEDQGRYVCTSLKYHTSRILYVVVQSKNGTEHYSRKKRDLSGRLTETDSKEDSDLNHNPIDPPVLTSRGLFHVGRHLFFIAVAFILVSLIVLLVFMIKLFSKRHSAERMNILQPHQRILTVDRRVPYSRLSSNP